MKQIKTTAIVLSRTNFGEADRILSVITPDYGKMRLMARGVRRVKSKLAGGIELFSISQISFIVGRGEIRTLTSSRLEKHFANIAKDVQRTMFGYEALKLIDKNTEDEAGEEYFELLAKVLKSLNDGAIPLDLTKFWLYLQLLSLGGHSPNLKRDSGGKALAEDAKYGFDLDAMAFSKSSNSRYNSKHVKLIRVGLSSSSPQQLVKINDIDEVLAQSLQLITTMLKQFVRI